VAAPRRAGWSRVAAALAIGTCFIGAGLPAWAEKTDRDQPLTFSADRMRLDEKRRVRVLSGDVEIAKGTLLIRAAQIELRETPQGTVAMATGSAGKPATFRQKRDGVDEVVEGQAQRIDYDARNDTVRFTHQASVRRYRGSVLADEISGQSISYDAVSEVIEVQGAASGSNAGSSGRVRGVLAPTPAASQ
jgi:lipopolysaccharide export system protein LptA